VKSNASGTKANKRYSPLLDPIVDTTEGDGCRIGDILLSNEDWSLANRDRLTSTLVSRKIVKEMFRVHVRVVAMTPKTQSAYCPLA
jgi:hypothetical protein